MQEPVDVRVPLHSMSSSEPFDHHRKCSTHDFGLPSYKRPLRPHMTANVYLRFRRCELSVIPTWKATIPQRLSECLLTECFIAHYVLSKSAVALFSAEPLE